jgi:hypothetical protein
MTILVAGREFLWFYGFIRFRDFMDKEPVGRVVAEGVTRLLGADERRITPSAQSYGLGRVASQRSLIADRLS